MNTKVFPMNFVRIAVACITLVSLLIPLNGLPTPKFKVVWVVRKGDPISPFLFPLAIKYLSRKLDEVTDNPKLKFHPRRKKNC